MAQSSLTDYIEKPSSTEVTRPLLQNQSSTLQTNEFDMDLLDDNHLNPSGSASLPFVDEEELDAILESIQSGSLITHKKYQYQALCAAIAHEDQVRFVSDYLSKINTEKGQVKYATAKSKILAYRVSQQDPIQQKEVLAEGFDDDGEDGAGEKLLAVLQKMDIGNIMVVVCIWNNGVSIADQKQLGGEFYKIISERARDLLKGIKAEVVELQPDAAENAKV